LHYIEPAAGGLALESAQGQAYDEKAFRYFLALERKRAERAGRSLVLLLVNLKSEPGQDSRIAPATAAKLFPALWLSLREVDFIGWLREGRVAAAVLAQGAELPAAPTFRRVNDRLSKAVADRLPVQAARRLRLRVVELRPGLKQS
jgi:hypothetical protein